MRAVLIVLGIAIVGLAIAIASRPRRMDTLTPYPQLREDQKRDAIYSAPKPGDKEPAFNPPREGVVTATMSIGSRGDLTTDEAVPSR